MPLPRFVVNDSATGGDRAEAEEASSSESEQDEEADVTDAEEEEDDGSEPEEPEQANGQHTGPRTALPRSVPAEETPRAKLTFKLKKQRVTDEVCHVRLNT